MIRIIVQPEIAAQIRQANGQVELVDDRGVYVGVVRRPPTQTEIQVAKSRIGSTGPKTTIEELISKLEAM